VALKVCDRYLAEFAEAEVEAGFPALLPWLLYGGGRPGASNEGDAYARWFGGHSGACDVAAAGDKPPGKAPGSPAEAAANAAADTAALAGARSSASAGAASVFERMRVDKSSLLAAFESQLDAAVRPPFTWFERSGGEE
jgi:hypothetical protein